jgi:hypothetical protein
MLILTPLFIAGFVHNLLVLRDPWIRTGAAWALATFLYMFWGLLRKGANRLAPEEPCTRFLRREFEGKRRGLLRIQRGLLLLIPAVLASWWGGGPVLGAKNLGVHSTRVLDLLAGPALPVVMALIIAFCWFSFWMQTRKVDREIERLGSLLSS